MPSPTSLPESGADSAAGIRRRLSQATDPELLAIYAEERTSDPALAAWLPQLPSADTPSRFTGLSHRDASQQALTFFRVTRDFARENDLGVGGPGLTQTYGEALIPESYAQAKYSAFFKVIKFTAPQYDQRLDQAVILMIK